MVNYPGFTDFWKIQKRGKHWDSSGSRQADLTPALVITLINNHDQCFWWMGLNLHLMTGGVWVRKRRGRRVLGTRGAEARRTGVKWTVLLHCEPTLFLSVGNLSPHVLMCVCFCVRPIHTMCLRACYKPIVDYVYFQIRLLEVCVWYGWLDSMRGSGFCFYLAYVCVCLSVRQVWDYVMLYSSELWRALFCITGGPVHPAESALCEV